MFRSVLTPSLYEFEPDMFSYIFTWFLVIRNLDSVPGLRILSMNQTGDIIRSLSLSRRIIKVSALVATSLHQLKELQVFRFPGYCTDEVVRELGLNCPKLTEVSFINSQGVTNASYPHLLSLRKLQFLDITGTRINNFHYGQLLSRLPNIADVRFINKEDDLIRLIAPNTIDTITHVTNIVTDTNMQIQKFPKTQKFILKTPNVDLSALTAWTELHTLEILLGDYRKINLNAVLMGIGHQLTVLILKRITRLNLLDIITLCKSLRNLDLYSCLILPVKAATPLNLQLPHFRNLIYLKIKTSVQDRTDFSFIRYYLNLERIELLGIDIFTEEFMEEVINLGTLANLKECYISETDKGALTLNVLEQLIHHCPNLKIFGHTKKLGLLNSENVLRLKRELSEQNFDIDIIS
ncbi:hypothetical protein B7P43_G05441 [Cryptotermes secundus]|uniref:F-box domain-containing protein n=2 Tax=Cryptotermes secundus TaxID=105785 RepID=A0A2J7QI74_9NEOP|nr:hypothetical protein B7P43_G05441 [Cryptotermes secundus]